MKNKRTDEKDARKAQANVPGPGTGRGRPGRWAQGRDLEGRGSGRAGEEALPAVVCKWDDKCHRIAPPPPSFVNSFQVNKAAAKKRKKKKT